MNNFVFDPSVKFIDPEKVLFAAGLSTGQAFVDLGAGGGFYSFAAGKIVGDQGLVYAVDILEPTLDHISAEARLKGFRNVRTLRADLEQAKSIQGIPTGSADMVLFANILHQIRDKKNLLAQAYLLLKTGGKLVVTEWNDEPSPIGPSASERISTSDVNKLALEATFKPAGPLPADIYHYGLIFIK